MDIVEKRLAAILSRNWWALLLRGLIAILFGLLVWFRPGISLAALVFLFGIYALADGFLGVWTAIAGDRQQEHWWVLLLWGLIGLGVGIMTFLAPGITAVALLFYIAIWAIATGFMQIVAAMRLRREIRGEWLLVLGGLASILFGMVLMARPIMGALAVLWLIGTYAVIFGVVLVILAFKVRALASYLARA